MTRSALEVNNLRFHYHDDHPALQGISLRVEEGESVGLIGPNGAGKSTLLMHLNGVLPDEPGDTSAVAVFGRPVTRGHLHDIRRDVGLLFQDPDDQLFCPTVYEDVAFGPLQFGLADAALDVAVKNALMQVGLEGFEKRSPHHLSNGEKQRVCLAGILACQPRILALDEPTSGLDPRGRRQLAVLLRSIPATKLIATHDLELVVELCPRSILLDRGVVIADGPTETLLSNEELMLAHGLEKPHILKHRHPH